MKQKPDSTLECFERTPVQIRRELGAWLRAEQSEFLDVVIPTIIAEHERHFEIPEERVRIGIHGTISALAEALESGQITPVELHVASLDSVWNVDAHRVDSVIRSLHIINRELNRRLKHTELAEHVDVLDELLWEKAALLMQRSTTIVTGQLMNRVRRHQKGETRLLGLQRVSTAVVSDLDLDQTLSMIVDEARSLLDSDTVAIRMLSDRPGYLSLLASSGTGALLNTEMELPLQGTLCGYVVKHGISALSNEPWTDARVSQHLLDENLAQSLLIAPLRMRDRVVGVIAVRDQQSRAFSEDDRQILELFADQAVSAIENARLYQQAQDQINELEILHQISSVVLSTLELDQVFALLYEQVRRLMNVDAFLVARLRDDERFDLEFIADEGEIYDARRAVDFSELLRSVVSQGIPVIVDDALHDRRYETAGFLGDQSKQSRSMLTVPMFRGDCVIGLISAQSYAPYAYREQDSRLLTTIANQAAIAIEHAHLYQQAQDLAIAEERNRLSREIHDTLAQGLTGIILCLESVEMSLEDTNREQQKWIERALRLSRSSLDEARRSVSDLRAATLDGQTFLDAVITLVRDLQQDESFLVIFTAPSSMPNLSARVEATLFRVIQEATTNCRKHSGCRNLNITLNVANEELILNIEDDGKGFDLSSSLRRHDRYGLSSMHERMAQVNGDLTIDTAPGTGTRVRASLELSYAIYGSSSFRN